MKRIARLLCLLPLATLFADVAQRAERPEFARDNISRGWDYREAARKRIWFGYGNDLALYCKKVRSHAFYLEIASF